MVWVAMDCYVGFDTLMLTMLMLQTSMLCKRLNCDERVASANTLLNLYFKF